MQARKKARKNMYRTKKIVDKITFFLYINNIIKTAFAVILLYISIGAILLIANTLKSFF